MLFFELKDEKHLNTVDNFLQANPKLQSFFIKKEFKYSFCIGTKKGIKKAADEDQYKEWAENIAGLFFLSSDDLELFGYEEDSEGLFSKKNQNLLDYEYYIQSEIPYEIILKIDLNKLSDKDKNNYYKYYRIKYGKHWKKNFEKSIITGEQERESIIARNSDTDFSYVDHSCCSDLCEKYRCHQEVKEPVESEFISEEDNAPFKIKKIIPKYGLNKIYEARIIIREIERIIKFEENEYCTKPDIVINRIKALGTNIGTKSRLEGLIGKVISTGIKNYTEEQLEKIKEQLNNQEISFEDYKYKHANYSKEIFDIDYSLPCENRSILLCLFAGLEYSATDINKFPHDSYKDEKGSYWLTLQHFNEFIRSNSEWAKLNWIDLEKIFTEHEVATKENNKWIIKQEMIDRIRGDKSA